MAADGLGDPRRQRLSRLMAVRLGVAVGALLLALVFVGVGREGAAFAERGLYATLALAFAASLIFVSALPFVTRLARFGALQIGADLAIVSSLVYFSGGAQSVFGFLYLPITVYGAMLFDRRGAYGSAVGASLGYGVAILAGRAHGIEQAMAVLSPQTPLFALWVVHTGALLMVALLGSALARELRDAGEALQESTSDLVRLRRLHARTVDSLTSGLLTTDSEGCISSLNPEAEAITGWGEDEALERPVEELLPGLQECLHPGAGGPQRTRMPYRCRDGTERHLGLAASVLRETDGSAAGHVVIFQDLSDVVRMEQELRRSERLAAAGQLAADMAHEIRNPLAAISGSIEILGGGLGGTAQDEERRRLMGIVLREVERLDRLIADFLQYARPAPPHPSAVLLAPMVAEVVEMFRASATPGIEAEVGIPPELAVHADPRQLRQLLWNLLLNASQAMPDGGRVTLLAEPVGVHPQEGPPVGRNDQTRESAWVEITVSDTGAGIPPDALERIFDPFFTTRRGGSGLGLATVHRVVEGNGGVLRVESEVGKGTRFVIRLLAVEVSQ